MTDTDWHGMDLDSRLRALNEDSDIHPNPEMVEEDFKCRRCGESHNAELFESPPDGWKVRYWCPKDKWRCMHSAF